MVQQYLDHCKIVLSDKNSAYKPNRTGVDSISRFGHRSEYDLGEGFPLLTTKRVSFKLVAHELIWFLRGDTNIKYLDENGVYIWHDNAFQNYLKKRGLDKELRMYSDEWKSAREDYVNRIKNDDGFAKEHGDLGPVYGSQWRRWKTSDGKTIDQIKDVVKMLQKNPSSRRIMVTAWNPQEIPNMALPPCHSLYQFNVRDGKLDCQLYQRSADMFLGVPFNIASYAMLTEVMAKQADLEPGIFSHVFGDAHFYCGSGERGKFYGDNLHELKDRVRNAADGNDYLEIKKWIEESAPKDTGSMDHVTAVLEQMSREPLGIPRLEVAKKPFDELTIDDFSLTGYQSHPPIKRAMAV